MSEDNIQDDSELFDATEDPESDPALKSTTDDQETEESGEEIKHNKAELNRQKQITSFKRRVEDGEITLDEIPHAWVRKAIEGETKKENVDERVKRILKEERETEKYADLRGRLNEANLIESKRLLIAQEYQDLQDAGLTKAKALEKAIAIAGVKLDRDDRYASRIPKITNAAKDPEASIKESLAAGEVPDIPAEKRLEHWEKLRKQTSR